MFCRQAIPIRRNMSRCDYGLVPRDTVSVTSDTSVLAFWQYNSLVIYTKIHKKDLSRIFKMFVIQIFLCKFMIIGSQSYGACIN